MSKEKKSGFGKFLAGAFVGAGLGILFAPNKGEKTRRELKVMLDDFVSKVKDLDKEEVKITIEQKIADIKIELEDLDKEKVLKIAKKKAKQIEDMAGELVDYAVEKGTPVLEKTANKVKEKAIEFTEQVLEKLKQEEN